MYLNIMSSLQVYFSSPSLGEFIRFPVKLCCLSRQCLIELADPFLKWMKHFPCSVFKTASNFEIVLIWKIRVFSELELSYYDTITCHRQVIYLVLFNFTLDKNIVATLSHLLFYFVLDV